MRAKNHQGFSLVELIVVVAIMASLVGIIAPAYMRYIEKTRIQRDESAAGEIYRAAEIVVYSGEYLVENTVLATFDVNGIQLGSSIPQAVQEEILVDAFGPRYMDVVPVSKKYSNKCYTIQILPGATELDSPILSGGWN